MFRNKHLVVAMLVAPVLAIMAWFAVDHFVAEQPHAAQEGAAYTLIAKSNCRYASGQCDLENSDFKLTIQPEMLAASSMALVLNSTHGLQGATFSVVEAGLEEQAIQFVQTNEDGTEWQGVLARPGSVDARIRVAVTAQAAIWYAEIPTVFLEPDTE